LQVSHESVLFHQAIGIPHQPMMALDEDATAGCIYYACG
jgi:hypothetical protein